MVSKAINRENNPLSPEDVSRVIEMAWEDRTPFEAIEWQFKIKESDVIEIMRRELNAKSFKNWRARVSGRATKHQQIAPDTGFRHRCPTQNKIKNK